MSNLFLKLAERCSAVWLFILSLLVSCTDPVAEHPDDSGNLFQLNEPEISLSSKAQYRSLQLIKSVDALQVTFSCDASWVHLQQDSLADDGWFRIQVDCDPEQVEREAHLLVTATDGRRTQTETCVIIQSADDGSNLVEEDAAKTMRVGYGYDIFCDYQNDVSVKESILDQNYISNSVQGRVLVETNSRSVLDVECETSRNAVELSEQLTKKQEVESSGICGSSTTVKNAQSSSYNRFESQYVYLRYYKTNAMRAVDIAFLLQLIEEGEPVFTTDFASLRDQIIANPDDRGAIQKLLTTYGTHLVVQGEMGTAIELTTTFSKDISGELDMRAEDFRDYFFEGKTSSFELATGKIKDMTCEIKADVNCHIYGGSRETVEALKTDINEHQKISQDKLLAWLNSTSGDISDEQVVSALVPISFRLIPIWELFPASCVRALMDEVMKFSETSVNKVMDSYAGTDFFQIDLTDEMLRFGDGADDTQVKVLYAKNLSNSSLAPVLEICNEYVPLIRGDRRIPVIYGIRNGSPFLGAGFFPGDGEGNPPAWITFSESDCYVKPIGQYSGKEQLRTLYYLNGNIYETNNGVACRPPLQTKLEEQYLVLSKSYPIVKIGEGYWTRKNIEEKLSFGRLNNPDNPYSNMTYKEKLIDGKYFAGIFYTNHYTVFRKYGNYYGYDENEVLKKRTKWYLPKADDVYHLKKYVGDNTKALLKQQPSGFEAQFSGVYGNWDDVTGKPFPTYRLQYENEYCFIPCKDQVVADNGTALLISKDYQLTTSVIRRSDENLYPVRLFRTAYWRYEHLD